MKDYGEEKNKLVDKAYMVIGMSQFYKKDYNQAINTFSFLTRKSLQPTIQSEALLWATKCHQELENKESIRKNIILLEEDFYLNKKQDASLDEIQASISTQEKYYASGIGLPFNLSFTCSTQRKKSAPIRSILFTKPILGTLYRSACLHTVSD